jgi:hypothetical protein
MAEYDFPDDLLDLQREFFAAEKAWKEAGKRGDAEATTAAYQRTQDAAMALHRHPWMNATENRYKARLALREAARG